MLVAGVVSKLFIEYKLRQQLDAQVASLAPFASIEYERIYLDADGGVNIEGVDASSPMIDLGGNKLASIRVSSENRWLFIFSALGLSDSAIPEVLFVETDGVELGLLFSDYLGEYVAAANTAFAETLTPSCGDIQYLSASDLQQMGYGALNFDLDFSYAYSPARSVLELSFDVHVPDLADAKGRLIVGGVASLQPGALIATAKPSLQLIEVDYVDHGYTRKVNRYCSERVGVSVEEYVAKEVARNSEYYVATWGINPGYVLRDAYQDFLLDPRSINFAAYPSEDFDYEHLSLYAPKDWAGLLKLSLLVNDRAVAPLEFTLDANISPQMLIPSDESEVVETIAPEKQFVEVSKKELADYEGYKIRVYSVNGRKRQGIFTGLRHGNIEITSEKYGKAVGVSVSVFSTEKIEVYK